MEPNKILREELFKIIDNQLKANNPPETKLTYTRLMSQGYSTVEAKQLIGQCLVIEIFGALKYQEPFDEERYIKNLKNLPKPPFEEK